MIYQKEIADIAEKKGFTKNTIDKDWVLGHFVNAIYQSEVLKNKLIFKGGTCLRKCYLENYRFSEDLDFTAVQKDFNFTLEILEDLCEDVSKNTGIQLYIKSLKPLHYKNLKTGYQAKIRFWGADHSRNQKPPEPIRWQTEIKIEITLFEKILFKPLCKNIIHLYSDKDKINTHAVCYDLREVLSEKLRAMIQRSYTAPRDYYDFWYLSKYQKFNWIEIKEAFLEKMNFKGLQFQHQSQFIDTKVEKTLNIHWKSSLGSHLPQGQLPECNEILKDLKVLFNSTFESQ